MTHDPTTPTTPDAEVRVVVNHEGQYSVLPVSRELPPGWHDTGVTGPRQACLEHVAAVWTDQTPFGLRPSTQEVHPGAR